MKHWMLAIALVCFGSSAFAQDVPAPAPAPAPAPISIDLFQIGSDFGVNHAWKFGIDKGATVGACIQREVHDGQWLAGPCRDIFILAKKQGDGSLREVAHIGGAIMYNTERGNPTYSVRAGVNVGPMAHASLEKLANDIPGFEGIANFKAPKWLAYAGNVTTVDFAAGYRPVHNADVIGNWTYGPMVKADIPLDDIFAILKAGI